MSRKPEGVNVNFFGALKNDLLQHLFSAHNGIHIYIFITLNIL